MKHVITFILLIGLLCSFAACAPEKEANADPTGLPATDEPATEVPATDEPTAVPTEAPTEAPTESPTAVPTETPAPVILSFEECAEEILKLVPYKAYDTLLPEDAAENEVLYHYEDEGMSTALGPMIFAIDSDTIVVVDYGIFLVKGMSVYDADGCLVNRKNLFLNGDELGALANGKLYTLGGAFDIETGEPIEEYLISDDVYAPNIQWTGTIPKLIVLSTGTVHGVYTISFDYYELTENNFWMRSSGICSMVEDYYGEWTKISLSTGAALTFDGVGYEVLGMDLERNYYFKQYGNTIRLVKVSPEGVILSELEISYTHDELWDPGMMIRLSDDGTVYVAAALPDDFLIWKITME